MKTVKLSNGIEMPILGFGVFQIPAERCERCVSEAIETGYRLFDTAASYLNECEVGKAIKNSGVKREDIFLTTKLWLQDFGYERAKEAFQRSLERLQTDYIDLYLLHKPLGDYYGAWRALEELYEKRAVHAIGVCNFYPDRLVDLTCNARITPMVNQMETHVFWQHNGYQKLMQQKGVQLESWGTFVEGRNGFFQNEVLLAIANNHHVSVAQVALRWLIQRSIVCIPKTIHKERMAQNMDVFTFQLSNEEMETIKTLDLNKSMFYSHHDPEKVEWLNSLHYDI